MNAKLERINGAVLLQVLGNHGNPVNVILGGADGTLVTISNDGKLKVIPPEGPGDPEMRNAFKRLRSDLVGIGGYLPLPCYILSEEMGGIEEEIQRGHLTGTALKDAEEAFASIEKRYIAEGCNKGTTPPKR